MHNPNIQWRKYISIALDNGNVRMVKVSEKGQRSIIVVSGVEGALGVWDLESL
jgi:hypothetical protein